MLAFRVVIRRLPRSLFIQSLLYLFDCIAINAKCTPHTEFERFFFVADNVLFDFFFSFSYSAVLWPFNFFLLLFRL